MKLDNKQIIDSARRQRDLDTSSMNVQPWKRHRKSIQVPMWLVALPAAAIVGFLFGLFVHKSFSGDTSKLMTAADTVFVTRQVMVPQTPDTIIRYVERPTITQANKKTHSNTVSLSDADTAITGHSIDQDNIDYSMLVMR